jgi:hypothetical protein
MNLETFNRLILRDLTTDEIALINTNIYYNPDYIDYYMDFHRGKYTNCYKFLMNHRHLLTLDSTPRKWKKVAQQMINTKIK